MSPVVPDQNSVESQKHCLHMGRCPGLLSHRLAHAPHPELTALRARQAPLFMGSSREEHWGGLPCPPPGDLPDPGLKPTSLKSPVLAGRFFTTSASWEALSHVYHP